MARILVWFPVVALFVIACQLPALYMDSGAHQHGDNAGPGLGTIHGLVALTLGWGAAEFSPPWYANLTLLVTIPLLLFKKDHLAYASALISCALSLATPVLLWNSSSHPMAYPLAGYYVWQVSMLLALLAVSPFVPGGTKLRCWQVGLLLAGVAATGALPSIFHERTRGILLRVRTQVAPIFKERSVEFSLPGVYCDYDPRQTVTLYKSMRSDGMVEFEELLHPLGQPTVLVVSPHQGKRFELPLQRNDNVYTTGWP